MVNASEKAQPIDVMDDTEDCKTYVRSTFRGEFRGTADTPCHPLRRGRLFYSARKASDGSICEARRAGR